MERNMQRKLTLLVAAIAIIALSSEVSAQNNANPPGFGLGATIGGVSFSDSINDFNFGYAAEGNVRYSFESGFHIVGGVTYGKLNVENQSGDRDILGFWVDPRLTLNQGRPGVAPYIGGRLAYNSWDWSGEINGVPREASATGWTLGLAVGVYVPLARTLALEAALNLGFTSFGDIDLDGTSLPNSSDSGVSSALKVGLVYTFIR
jgi:hypothetical protein